METKSIIKSMGSDSQEYMNERQRMYFKNKLVFRKYELMGKISLQREKIKTLKTNHADILDRSCYSMDLEHEIRTYERYSQVLRQIDGALARIRDGRFGYCELTGKPIGLERLEALPFASLSIEALEDLESGCCK